MSRSRVRVVSPRSTRSTSLQSAVGESVPRLLGRRVWYAFVGGAAVLSASAVAHAQAGPVPGAPVGGGGASAAAPAAAAAAQPSVPTTTYAPLPGAQAGAANTPSAPSGTESSALPVQGDEEDSFDLVPGAHATGAVHGGEDGPIFSRGAHPAVAGEAPELHVVQRGDTLWGICNSYFKNPYQWPRIWSYNPQIKNPNWIYPGDQVRLRGDFAANAGGGGPGPTGLDMKQANGMTFVDRRRTVPNGTIFLRDQGWISDASDGVWGEITGASTDKMFLSELDEVYLSVKKGHDVRLGQELTIFRTRSTAAAGAIVQVLGTIRVDDWNEHDRVARGQVIEALDVIERGSKIGPVARAFQVVPPKRNDVDLQGHVLASLHPNEFFGQNQLVFIDRGESSGLKSGNRLFVLRRGDAWRQTMFTADMSLRISADDERPMPPMEQTPGSKRDDAMYPDELVAELRAVDVKKDSAVCLVTQAKVEIELNDLVVVRKGY